MVLSKVVWLILFLYVAEVWQMFCCDTSALLTTGWRAEVEWIYYIYNIWINYIIGQRVCIYFYLFCFC